MSNPLLVVAKKTPEESKVTKMMLAQGWTLTGGNDVWLIFKKKGVPGEVTVTRGSKEWAYDLPTTPVGEDPEAEGKGLQSLYDALPNIQQAKAMSAGAASTAVNSAAKGVPELCDPTKAPITATDHKGHAQ